MPICTLVELPAAPTRTILLGKLDEAHGTRTFVRVDPLSTTRGVAFMPRPSECDVSDSATCAIRTARPCHSLSGRENHRSTDQSFNVYGVESPVPGEDFADRGRAEGGAPTEPVLGFVD